MMKRMKRKVHSPYKEPEDSPWFPPVDESSEVPPDDSFFVHGIVIATVIMAGLMVVFLKAINIL